MEKIILIFLILSIKCHSRVIDYIIPFYNFSLHNTPVIFTNETALKNELNYYKNFKKISLLHVAGSTITSILTITTVGLGSSLFIYVTPLSLTYWGYHVYVTHKSSHIEQKCKFLIEDDKNDNRFYPPWEEYLQEYLKLPKMLFNPILFAILIYFYVYAYFYLNYKIKKVSFWVILLSLFYTFSFLQSVQESNSNLKIKKQILRNELKWTCHVNRMSFRKKITKTIFSLFGIQTDKSGYLVGDTKCKELELEINKTDETFIDILYKTFTRSFLTILKELFNSLKFIDKILMILLSILLLIIKYKNKNKKN